MLQVREKSQHQTKVFILTGQFCRKTTRGIQAKILGAKETGHYHIILDFSEVTQIDSTGLGELFLWYHHMRPHQVQICIVNPPKAIRKSLHQMHISEIVPIYNSKHEALEYAGCLS